jgi:hypothetical protein
MRTRTLTALSAIGLFLAAGSWALHQQIDYMLASMACSGGKASMWVATLVAGIVLAVAAVTTLRLPRWRPGSQSGSDEIARPRQFLAAISLLAVLLFLFALFLQASATLFLPVCV